LQLASGSVLCVQANSKPWSCTKQPATPAGTQASSPLQLLTGLPNLAGQIVSPHKTSIGGRSVQCFDFTSLEMCVTSDGIPARISSPEIRYELTALQTTVADDVFTPPATPH
jgi:hypothetical protein